MKRRRMLITVTLLGALFSPLAARALSWPFGESGEGLYQKEKYDEALKAFTEQQVADPKNQRLRYNIGNTHYRLKKYDDAQKAFEEAAQSENPEFAEKAVYNLGNTAYQQGKLEEAIAYYQKALELDPKDDDARNNLEFVREELKRRMNEQQKREEEQKQNPKPPEKPKGKDKDQQKNQPKEQPQSEPSASPSEQAEQKQSQEQKGQEAEQGEKMSPKEAEALLQNIQEARKNLDKERAKRVRARSVHPDKDW